MTQPAPLFDSARIGRYRARASKRYADHSFLNERAWEDVLNRLDSVTRSFETGVLINPFASGLAGLPAFIEQQDAIPAVAPQSQDLVISLMHLHLENDLPGALRTALRSLRPDGLFLGALFGERTLHELRAALLQAESECCGGAQARIIPFAEIKALGGLMQRAGFALPVVDVDRVTVRYGSVTALMHDLRGMGQSNPLTGPVRPLRRDVLGRTEEIYRERYGTKDGRLAASFEIVHVCGWAPHESQQKPLKPGSAQISLHEVFGQSPKNKPR
ncbi:MAG: SAM-dependent methyltransferase [Robiginitomaculum sp.]|nr:MAG: SAM-dependent methyltransferase [Robiginitomaculum sp.]